MALFSVKVTIMIEVIIIICFVLAICVLDFSHFTLDEFTQKILYFESESEKDLELENNSQATETNESVSAEAAENTEFVDIPEGNQEFADILGESSEFAEDAPQSQTNLSLDKQPKQQVASRMTGSQLQATGDSLNNSTIDKALVDAVLGGDVSTGSDGSRRAPGSQQDKDYHRVRQSRDSREMRPSRDPRKAPGARTKNLRDRVSDKPDSDIQQQTLDLLNDVYEEASRERK